MSACRQSFGVPAVRGVNDNRPDAAPNPHALRVVALLTLGFWAVVGVSCAAWVLA